MIFVVIMIIVLFFAICLAISDISGSDNKEHKKSSRRSTPRANRSNPDRGFTSEEFALYKDIHERRQQHRSTPPQASQPFYSGDAGDFAAFENGAADAGMVDSERCW
ncbi:MAG: hypothetical protein MR919_12420 [Parabacteroides sp.]|nr:hypothetical protein [Parabacteroides sp.]